MNRILTKTVIAILAVTMMVGGIIFYACQKEKEVANNTKIQKMVILENPFSQVGIWHNAALEALVDNTAYPSMTNEDIWEAVGILFNEYCGSAYIHRPVSDFMQGLATIKNALEENQLVAIIVQLGEIGILDENYTSPLISRNNYTILYEYWSEIENMRASLNSDLIYLGNITKAMEQEILGNYYALLTAGEAASEADEMQENNLNQLLTEYKMVLEAVSVANYSYSFWSGKTLNEMDADDATRLQIMERMCVDAYAGVQAEAEGFNTTTNERAAYTAAMSGIGIW